jgi:hypothetical protein
VILQLRKYFAASSHQGIFAVKKKKDLHSSATVVSLFVSFSMGTRGQMIHALKISGGGMALDTFVKDGETVLDPFTIIFSSNFVRD